MNTLKQLLLSLAVLALAAACTPTKNASAPAASTTGTAPAAPPQPGTEDFRATAPEPGPAPEIQLGDFQDFTLDNGLRVVLVENHKLPRVGYQLFVDVPPHLEGGAAGASSLVGSMLRRATGELTKEQIDERIDFIGANLSTSASGAFASTITKYRDEVLELMADVVLDARFPQEEFDKVKSEALAGLQAEVSDPSAIADRVRRAVVYGTNHPYGELVTEETLGSVTLAQVRDYYRDYFVPNRSYLVMTGDLTRETAERLAREHFADWEAREVAVPEFPRPTPPSATTVNFVPRPGAVQSNIIIANPVDLQPGSKEAIRGRLLNTILGSGFNGRLFLNLREDKGYTYGAYSSLDDDPVVGSFAATANVRNEVTDSAVTEFLYELRRIATEPVSEDDLELAKSELFGSFGRALERPQQIARYALNTVRYDLDRDFYPTFLQRAQASSVNDLTEVAETYITPDNTHIIVVGDKAVAEKLARFATNGRVNYYDVNGQPLAMEAQSNVPADVTPAGVLRRYAEAIGGPDKITAIRNYRMVMSGTIQGQPVEMTTVKDGGTRSSTTMSMMGMTMMDQRYADGKAFVKMQGQDLPVDEAGLAGMREQAALFPVVDLLERADEFEIGGMSKIGGDEVVKLVSKDGRSEHFFDATTGLQVRMVQQQGPQRVTFNLGNYRPLNGVLVPYSMEMVGAAPFPMKFTVQTAEANVELDDSLFTVD